MHRWIRTPDELSALARSLSAARVVALDTESDSLYHYFDKVCLLQIASPEGAVALVDPLALRDLSALSAMLADARVEKILHAAENDIALLKRDFGLGVAGVFDTHLAARLCGLRNPGLDTLLETQLQVRLAKNLQRRDWSRRPLSPEQESYAAEDVRHLFALRDRLEGRLRSLGRHAWAQEEFEDLARVPPAERREAADFLKAKGARDLSGRSLAILRELFRLREEWARRADLPLFKVVSDEALVALAERRPRDIEGLRPLTGLPARMKERHAPDVLAAIRRGEAVPEAELPRRERPTRLRPRPAFVRRVDRLKAWRAEASERAELDPGLLLPQRLIDVLAAAPPDSIEDLARVPGIRRWRVEEFGKGLLGALDGD